MKTNDVYRDLERYKYAILAERLFASEQDRPLVSGTLEKLAEDMGREPEDGFTQGSNASPEGQKIAIDPYVRKYNKALDALTFGQLWGYHDRTVKDYVGDEVSEKYKNQFDKFADETLGSVRERLKKAKYILSGKGIYDFSAEEKKDAEEVSERFEKIMGILEILEQVRMEELRPEVTKRTYQNLLTKFADSNFRFKR